MFQYTYTDETPRDFPTIGLRDVKKGDVVTSEEPLNNPFLQEIVPPKQGKTVANNNVQGSEE